jgi:hypothetical protein
VLAPELTGERKRARIETWRKLQRALQRRLRLIAAIAVLEK